MRWPELARAEKEFGAQYHLWKAVDGRYYARRWLARLSVAQAGAADPDTLLKQLRSDAARDC